MLIPLIPGGSGTRWRPVSKPIPSLFTAAGRLICKTLARLVPWAKTRGGHGDQPRAPAPPANEYARMHAALSPEPLAQYRPRGAVGRAGCCSSPRPGRPLVLPADHLVPDADAPERPACHRTGRAGISGHVRHPARPSRDRLRLYRWGEAIKEAMRTVASHREAHRRAMTRRTVLLEPGMFCFRADVFLRTSPLAHPTSTAVPGSAGRRLPADDRDRARDLWYDSGHLDRPCAGAARGRVPRPWPADVGSWKAVSELTTPDAQGNARNRRYRIAATATCRATPAWLPPWA